MKNIKAASVQFQHRTGAAAANLDIISRFVESAAGQGCRLIVFPECCISGYWGLREMSREQLLALAEPVPGGPSSAALMAMAQEHKMVVGAGLVELSDDGQLYNTFVVAMPDGRFARHRKLHCFINQHMASGDQFTVFDTPLGVRMGVLICYDNNIIENARATALAGAEVLLAPHQTGGCNSGSPCAMGLVDVELWERREQNPQAIEAEFRGDKGRAWLLRWLPSRAHDNGMFLVFSNGVGRDDNEVRTGNAMILDPYGRTLAETWRAADDMVVAELDGQLLERSTGARWMRARRPELYQSLATPTGKEEDTRAVRFEHANKSEPS